MLPAPPALGRREACRDQAATSARKICIVGDGVLVVLRIAGMLEPESFC